MNVLVFNCGSSTLKFQVLSLDEDTPFGGERRLVHGIVEKIGGNGLLKFIDGGQSVQETIP